MLYVDLINRLREDAAAAVNEAIRVKGEDDKPVTAGEIITRRAPGSDRWHSRVNRSGWLGRITSDSSAGYDSEIEALCSIVEEAGRTVEEPGGVAPLHVVEDADQNRLVLTTYRAQFAEVVKMGGALSALLAACDALDHVAELSDLAAEIETLRATVSATRTTRPTDLEIEALLAKLAEATGGGERRFKSMSYEHGLANAIRWMRGEEPYGGEQEHPYPEKSEPPVP